MPTRLIAQAQPIGGTFECIGGYCPGDVSGGTGDGAGAITLFASNLLGLFTSIAGLYFLIYFILGGIKWITAGGEAGKIDNAKSQMTNAAIGLIVVVSAYAIAFIIGNVLGLDILNPSTILNLGPSGGGSVPGGSAGGSPGSGFTP